MSSENVDAIRRAFEGYAWRRDRQAFLGMIAPDAVWDLSRSPFPDARVYHGRDGVADWLGGLDDAFEDIRYEVEEVTDLGEGQVLSIIRLQGHGKFSKIDVDYRFVPVFTFRHGKVVRMDRYGDRAEALAAAGLPGGSSTA
jgi:ketosteroid isomerase-like protein